MRSVWVMACSQAGQREVCASDYCFSLFPSPSQMNALVPLTPPHSFALDVGHVGPGKILDLGMQRQPRDPGHSPNRVTIIGPCTSSALEVAQTSDGSVAARIPMTTLLQYSAQSK